ncbi:hypothetical protein C1645_765372 [Glomus cerebriforme]|uniref:Uncharacterized protein n=1 Tax=Glomus cerebriforme TaxID=658196 RepID=A0A397T615_9GLOM|nr:hypothetical protein C1645_765372 [Glomus cerebriforme]
MDCSQRLSKRKVKVHPQKQKCTENFTENIENNTKILNTRSTNLLPLKEQQKPRYLSYEHVFPSHQSSLKQLHDNTQDTQDNTNILPCSLPNNSIFSHSEENIAQQQKDVSVRAAESNDMTSLKVAQKGSKGNWFEEIKKIYFSLVEKINVFKMIPKNRIVKDHWKEDNTTNCCSFCNRKFTMFFRKHHCRM